MLVSIDYFFLDLVPIFLIFRTEPAALGNSAGRKMYFMATFVFSASGTDGFNRGRISATVRRSGKKYLGLGERGNEWGHYSGRSHRQGKFTCAWT